MNRHIRYSFAFLALFTLASARPAWACPNCKDAIGSDPSGESQKLADGYSHSILLMMSVPFVLVGAGGLMVVRAARAGRLPEL